MIDIQYLKGSFIEADRAVWSITFSEYGENGENYLHLSERHQIDGCKRRCAWPSPAPDALPERHFCFVPPDISFSRT